MAITACCAVPALAAPGSVAPESGKLYTSGTQTTTEGVVLGKDMTFGSLSSSVIPGDSIPYGGNFYASSYTISLWLDSSSLSTGSQTALFGYLVLVLPTVTGQTACTWLLTASLEWGMEP